MVDLIEKDHIIRGAVSVTQAILQKWLTSDAPTRTYQHLIECLRQSELGALAELIENTARRYDTITHSPTLHSQSLTHSFISFSDKAVQCQITSLYTSGTVSSTDVGPWRIDYVMLLCFYYARGIPISYYNYYNIHNHT